MNKVKVEVSLDGPLNMRRWSVSVLWWILHMAGTVANIVGLIILPPVVFHQQKGKRDRSWQWLCGVTIPLCGVMVAALCTTLITRANRACNLDRLRSLIGAPNLVALTLSFLCVYMVNDWSMGHRIDIGVATGNLDDARKGWAIYKWGTCLTTTSQIALTWCVTSVSTTPWPRYRKRQFTVLGILLIMLGLQNMRTMTSASQFWAPYFDEALLDVADRASSKIVPLTNTVSALQYMYKQDLGHMRQDHTSTIRSIPSKRIAITICGELFRFHYKSTMEHLVSGAVRAGYEVDMFVELADETLEESIERKKANMKHAPPSWRHVWRQGPTTNEGLP